jgi:hypothetical protein
LAISLRTRRALVLEYHDAGTAGAVDSTYLVRASSAADEMWWCSKNDVSGREITTGMQSDHRVDAVFVFAAECPVAVDDAIVCDGSYKVHAIMARQYGHAELEVLAERVAELSLTI